MSSSRWVVDRIEGKLAVLVSDDGVSADVPMNELPAGVREGAVVNVTVGEDAEPDWSCATIDVGEERRRLEEAREILEELKRRDGGGDVVL